MSTKGTEVLEFVNKAIATGRTVYFTNAMKSIPVSPRTVKAWAKKGNTLFKINNDGDLMMASGNSFVRITSGPLVMMKISAQ